MTLHTFRVFQQFPPTRIGEKNEDGDDLHAANLLYVGEVEAKDEIAALQLARQWTRFSGRSRSSLMGYPIVGAVPLPVIRPMVCHN